MKRTLGFHQLNPERQQLLLDSVRNYARRLDQNPGFSTLSDLTGFSPETIRRTLSMSRTNGLGPADWSHDALFRQNSSSLTKLVNIMLSIPEIKDDLEKLIGNSPVLSHAKIANMITDWVEGKSMSTMANEYFSNVVDPVERLTRCVRAVHRHLVNSATWGMAAIQRSASGIDFDSLSEPERRRITDLPSMVYYGVDTSEAIALRKAKVPRSMSRALSAKLRQDFDGNELRQKTGSDIEAWVQGLSDSDWQHTATRHLSANDNRRVWKILNKA